MMFPEKWYIKDAGTFNSYSIRLRSSQEHANLPTMKLFVIAALLVVVSAAPQDLPAGVVSAKSEMNADGSYSFSYETEDKIKVEETGSQKQIGDESGTVAQGSYSFEYDGVTYTVNWIADENGFQATGDHLPKRK